MKLSWGDSLRLKPLPLIFNGTRPLPPFNSYHLFVIFKGVLP